jgi:hypothetical protein
MISGQSACRKIVQITGQQSLILPPAPGLGSIFRHKANGSGDFGNLASLMGAGPLGRDDIHRSADLGTCLRLTNNETGAEIPTIAYAGALSRTLWSGRDM